MATAQAKQEKMLTDLQRKMLLFSDGAVIKSWVEGMRIAESDPREMVLQDGRTLLAIRAELEHDDSGLELRDLLRLFITDVDEIVPAGTK